MRKAELKVFTVLAVASSSLLTMKQLLDLVSQILGSSFRLNQMGKAGGLESKVFPSDTVMWEVTHSTS